jgi:hypothetical protein
MVSIEQILQQLETKQQPITKLNLLKRSKGAAGLQRDLPQSHRLGENNSALICMISKERGASL